MNRQEMISRLEAKGFNRLATMKIIAKVAAQEATVEQYEFAAVDLGLVARLNAEADADTRAGERAEAALNRIRDGQRQPGDYGALLGFEDDEG